MSVEDQIKKGIDVIFKEGDTIEIRAFGDDILPFVKRFNTRDSAAKTIAALSNGNKYNGVYYTLNSIPFDIAGGAAADKDVSRRRWLFIDCDAVRTKNVSSTDTEKAASFAVAKSIKEVMATRGWPTPVEADSGNGAHLLYRIDLPNSADSALLVRNILSALGKLFSSEYVTVDPVVFNAARITKAYGSIVRKGQGTAERPHRYSSILSEGEDKLLTAEQMQKLVSDFIIEPKPSQLESEGFVNITDASSLTPERMEEFLAHCDVNHYPSEPYYQGDQGGVRFIIEQCPWSEEHSGKDLKKDAAVFVLENGQFGYKCFHAHCLERGWKEFREKVSDGKKKFSFVDTGNVIVGGKNKLEQISAVPLPVIKMRTMSQVKAEPLDWLWYGRIPKGSLVIFAGDPSRGKSIFTLDIIARLSKGSDFIDGGKNTNGPCESIILSCEDDPNKIIKPRLDLAGADCNKIHLLETITDNTGERMLRLDKDITRLSSLLQANPGVKLIMIDPVSNYVGQRDMHKDQDMRGILTPLSSVARDFDVSMILIWHNNKTKGGTGLQKVGGSLGMHGVARMGWSFMEHEEEPNVKLMLQIKENYGKFPGITFETQGQDVDIDGSVVNVAKVAFRGFTEQDANTLIAKQSDYKFALVSGKKNDISKSIVISAFEQSGGEPVPTTEFKNLAMAKGVKLGTVTDAAKALGYVSEKIGSQWLWLKPTEDKTADVGGQAEF